MILLRDLDLLKLIVEAAESQRLGFQLFNGYDFGPSSKPHLNLLRLVGTLNTYYLLARYEGLAYIWVYNITQGEEVSQQFKKLKRQAAAGKFSPPASDP